MAKEDNSVVLFGDEVSFAMWGSLARTWAPIGQQPTVKTTGTRKDLKMFGTIELKGGNFQEAGNISSDKPVSHAAHIRASSYAYSKISANCALSAWVFLEMPDALGALFPNGQFPALSLKIRLILPFQEVHQ